MSNHIDLIDLNPLFWDVDFETLSWEGHRNFIIQRVLMHGSLAMLRWLREKIGDQALADWIVMHQGGGLSPRQLRYWELILDLPNTQVDGWVEARRESIWENRGVS